MHPERIRLYKVTGDRRVPQNEFYQKFTNPQEYSEEAITFLHSSKNLTNLCLQQPTITLRPPHTNITSTLSFRSPLINNKQLSIRI